MAPAHKALSLRYMSAGATQLLVGPASSAVSVQRNVHSSLRDTSRGSER